MANKYLEEAKDFANKMIEFFHLKNHLDDNSLFEMTLELTWLYGRSQPFLDAHFINEVRKINGNAQARSYNCAVAAYSRLWEVIILNSIMAYKATNKKINLAFHVGKGPDWKITLANEKEHYIEATTINFPQGEESKIRQCWENIKYGEMMCHGSEIYLELQDKITKSIEEKIKRDSAFMQEASNKKIGYIIALSYGPLPFLMVKPPEELSYFSELEKTIFSNSENNWISAILLSRVEPCLLLENAKKIPWICWKEKNNDFHIIHNPNARNLLTDNIFKH